jgi:hypothetical protein
VSDFIADLRADLVQAAERERDRTRVGRAWRSLQPWVLRPEPIAAGLAIAAAIAAALLSVLLLAPRPAPGNPHVVGAIHVGGVPVSAALGDGSLWVTDYDGALLEIDPGSRRVVARIATQGSAGALATAPGAVWVRVMRDDHRTRIVRIDPARRRVILRRALPFGEGMTFGAGVVWAAEPTPDHPPGRVLAVAPGTGTVVGSVPINAVDALVVAGPTLWTLASDGTLTQADTRSRRVVGTFPRLASGTDATAPDVIAADGDGAWVLGAERAATFRIAGGRVVRRIPVGPQTRPPLIRDGDDLWVATRAASGGHRALARIDTSSGRVTATIDLGSRRPIAIVPTRAALYVLTAEGDLLMVHRA